MGYSSFLQSGLLENALVRLLPKIFPAMIGHGDNPNLDAMLEVSVAPRLPDLVPTIGFEHADDFADFHGIPASCCIPCTTVYRCGLSRYNVAAHNSDTTFRTPAPGASLAGAHWVFIPTRPVRAASIDADWGASAFCAQGACFDGTRSCPLLQPKFSSINSRLLQVGCGVGQLNCHAGDSVAVQSGPSFAGHPYTTLVNAPAANRLGSARGLVLVKPADPGASLLITKLQPTSTDPAFGPGQPASPPGSP